MYINLLIFNNAIYDSYFLMLYVYSTLTIINFTHCLDKSKNWHIRHKWIKIMTLRI